MHPSAYQRPQGLTHGALPSLLAPTVHLPPSLRQVLRHPHSLEASARLCPLSGTPPLSSISPSPAPSPRCLDLCPPRSCSAAGTIPFPGTAPSPGAAHSQVAQICGELSEHGRRLLGHPRGAPCLSTRWV